jgi:hypothetical protein
MSAGAPSSIIRTISHDQLGTLARLDDEIRERLTLLDLGAVHISLDPSHLSVTQLQPTRTPNDHQSSRYQPRCHSYLERGDETHGTVLVLGPIALLPGIVHVQTEVLQLSEPGPT